MAKNLTKNQLNQYHEISEQSCFISFLISYVKAKYRLSVLISLFIVFLSTKVEYKIYNL